MKESGVAGNAGTGREFRRFVCWNAKAVSRIMDPEALQTPDEVFLATHTSIPMYRADLSSVGGSAALRKYDDESLLRDLLAPDDYAFVAVLGGAGTGKSHLIRWLSTRIPQSETRRVLLIPRSGTSLHTVLYRILDGMDGPQFDEYRRSLGAFSSAMTADEATVHLLDNLAIALEKVAGTVGAEATEEEAYLSAELPHLLRDPVFRLHFLRPGSVLSRLAAQILGVATIERAEERREFAVSDLPLRFQDVHKASKPAQQIYRDLVANESLRQPAVIALSRHLDEAVGRLMRLGGKDLLRLMTDVRVALAEREVELVVLIEDLATLQGIDQQLLEALIVRPRQSGGAPLCAMRTAVAMTSGYYEGLRKNVHQRFDFRVVMGESDTRGRVSQIDVERFTARYLNASRLDGDALIDWHQRLQAAGDSDEPVPSACEPCEFRPSCHRAFGAHDGMGLYPFTSLAIANIASRVSPEGFNPRTQLKEGYRPVLENDVPALSDGRFPPPELLERLGGVRLPALMMTELRRLDPVHYQRRAALLDLWGSARGVQNLDPVIHRAFDLSELTIGPNDSAVAPVHPTTETHTPDADVRTEGRDPQLDEIDAWSAGETMSQKLAQTLREVVYPAVVWHIDWNALHLIPGDFAGAGKAFRQSHSISFANQYLKGSRAAIQLQIPLREEETIEAALALQALLLFKRHRSWNFESGGKYYRAYLRQVAAWSAHVLDQINRITESRTSWDPVPATVELLAFGARIVGRPRARDPERPDLIDAVFADLPERDDADHSEPWQELVKLVLRHQKKTRSLLLSRIGCSKGDSRQLQVIDAGRILPALSKIQHTWRPAEPMPDDLDSSSRFLREYRDGIGRLFERAVAEEKEYQLARYGTVARALGAEGDNPETAALKRKGAADAMRRAVESAKNNGVLSGVQSLGFEEALGQFEAVQFQAWSENVERVRTEDDNARLLVGLSLMPNATGRVCTDFLTAAETMLDRTDHTVREELRAGGNGGDDDDTVGEVQTRIRAGLDTLIADLSMLISEPQ